MPSTQTSIDARAALRAAVNATALRLAPGHGLPDPRHLSLLSEVEAPASPRVWADSSARALSAMFAARARRDALGDGAALVWRFFDGTRLIRPASLSMEARAVLLAGAGEYLCAVGLPQVAVRFGREAQLFADSDATRFYALTVTALGFALNGEYTSADPVMDAASALFRTGGWAEEESSYLLLLADSLVAAARMDHLRLRGWHESSSACTRRTRTRDTRPGDRRDGQAHPRRARRRSRRLSAAAARERTQHEPPLHPRLPALHPLRHHARAGAVRRVARLALHRGEPGGARYLLRHAARRRTAAPRPRAGDARGDRSVRGLRRRPLPADADTAVAAEGHRVPSPR